MSVGTQEFQPVDEPERKPMDPPTEIVSDYKAYFKHSPASIPEYSSILQFDYTDATYILDYNAYYGFESVKGLVTTHLSPPRQKEKHNTLQVWRNQVKVKK